MLKRRGLIAVVGWPKAAVRRRLLLNSYTARAGDKLNRGASASHASLQTSP
jgi:hypothetical protein